MESRPALRHCGILLGENDYQGGEVDTCPFKGPPPGDATGAAKARRAFAAILWGYLDDLHAIANIEENCR